jgi:hypothetical protein
MRIAECWWRAMTDAEGASLVSGAKTWVTGFGQDIGNTMARRWVTTVAKTRITIDAGKKTRRRGVWAEGKLGFSFFLASRQTDRISGCWFKHPDEQLAQKISNLPTAIGFNPMVETVTYALAIVLPMSWPRTLATPGRVSARSEVSSPRPLATAFVVAWRQVAP